MKMFLVIYPDYFDGQVTGAFKQAGYNKYTKIHGTTGEGEETMAKLGASYAPGTNKTLLMAVPNAEITHLLEIIQKLRAEHPAGGFRAFTIPLEECI
jgi:hypothetical protein